MTVNVNKNVQDDAVQIQFALISHTNNGKTTLARTLVGVDIGEVRDAAHVTVFAESHTLLATAEGDALQLWDTPGFGDSVRLLKRLGQAGNPIGWFLREVLDRYGDRPFWLSQQALRTARDAADVVLYLVKSSPRGIAVLLDQSSYVERMGDHPDDRARLAERVALWQQFCHFHHTRATVVNLLNPGAHPLEAGLPLSTPQ